MTKVLQFNQELPQIVELLSKYLVYKCEDKTTLDIDDIKEICILYIERIE